MTRCSSPIGDERELQEGVGGIDRAHVETLLKELTEEISDGRTELNRAYAREGRVTAAILEMSRRLDAAVLQYERALRAATLEMNDAQTHDADNQQVDADGETEMARLPQTDGPGYDGKNG